MEYNKDLLMKFYQSEIDNATSIGRAILAPLYSATGSNIKSEVKVYSVSDANTKIVDGYITMRVGFGFRQKAYSQHFSHKTSAINDYILLKRKNKWNLIKTS